MTDKAVSQEPTAQARRLAEKLRARAAGTELEELWPGLVAKALE